MHLTTRTAALPTSVVRASRAGGNGPCNGCCGRLTLFIQSPGAGIPARPAPTDLVTEPVRQARAAKAAAIAIGAVGSGLVFEGCGVIIQKESTGILSLSRPLRPESPSA